MWRKFGPEWQELASEEIQPSDDDWITFWNTLDESRIWSWDEAYYTEARRAGEDLPQDASIEELAELSDDILSWAVEILLKDGRYIDSSGSNAVPGQTAKSRSSRQRRRRGGRSRRDHKPEAEKAEVELTAIMLADSNAGIPDNTFDLFLGALKTLIQGKELGDEEEIPSAVETSFRGRTEKKRSRKSPLEALESETAVTKKVRKKRRTLRRRDGAPSNKSETTNTTHKRSNRRRKGTSAAGEGDASQPQNSGAEGATKKRRRRRKRSGKPSTDAAGAPTAANASTAESGGENKPPRRRRRRSNKPRNPEDRSGQTNGPAKENGPAGEGAVKKRRRRRRRRPGNKEGESSPPAGD